MTGDAPFVVPRSARAPYRPVGALLAAWKAREPERLAIVEADEGGRITFGELADAVDATAWRLARLGIEPGHRVVLTPRTGIETLILWFALWRLGATICPLDFALLRLGGRAVLDTLAPAFAIGDPDFIADPVFVDGPTRLIGHDGWPGRALPIAIDGTPLPHDPATVGAELARRAAPTCADIACIACTSGTTGRPKLVVYDHACFWENGQDSARLIDLHASDRLFEFRSLSWYSAQILTLMPFLQVGMTLYLARRFSLQNFPRWIAENRVTISVGVPGVINRLVHASDGPTVARLASLRLMTSSTAPLNTSHWYRFEERYGVRLLNLYGSSEAGWICGNRLDARRIGTVGRAVDDVRLTVVDEQGRPVDTGTPGHASIETPKLALGYLQRDGSIEPLRGRPLVLRDLVTVDPEAFVRVHGRSDDLINRGGVKISPAEIEEALLTHPDVREAAAIAVPDDIHGQQPVAFVVARDEHDIDVRTLLRHCDDCLARAKRPVDIVVVQSLPTSARGKLQRHRLQADYAAIVRAREMPH